MSTQITFEKLNNTRDLGGMETADGRKIRPGFLYRSGHLADITEADAHKLSTLVRTVYDFRTDGEREQQPDLEIPGAINIHMPIVDKLMAGISREEEADRNIFQTLLLKPAEAKIYMCRMYERFLEDFPVKQYGRFLKNLLTSEGGVLWHCTAGKDRAGIASVIVEEILGVRREEIVADYLMTNVCLAKDIEQLTVFVKRNSGIENTPLADEALKYLFGAEKEYIQTFYEAVNRKYGTLESFLSDGLGVDSGMADAMREKYLEG